MTRDASSENAKDRGDARQRGRDRRRAPKKATPEYLEKSALHYLERYASSAGNLRRVLMRKVERSARVHGTGREDGAQAVEALVQRLENAGILDDAAYADGRVATLHRAGHSRRAIQARLAAKGVAAETIEAALARMEEETAGDPELLAAVRYARKRRLGAYRERDRADNRQRDLAALCRKGFSPDLARRVVDAEDGDELEREAQAGT